MRQHLLYLALPGCLALLALACSDEEIDAGADGGAATPAPARTVQGTSQPLSDRHLLLLLAPHAGELEESWESSFALSEAEVEDFGLRLDFTGESALVTVVMELKESPAAAAASVEGFTSRFSGQGYTVETVTVGDRATRMTLVRPSGVVVDSLNFATGRLFTRLTAISDRETLAELQRLASALETKREPVAALGYVVDASPREGFSEADVEQLGLELAEELDRLYTQVLVLHPVFGVTADYDSDLMLDLWSSVVSTCLASQDATFALVWSRLADACLDIYLAEGAFFVSIRLDEALPNAGTSLLTAVHLRSAEGALLDRPWKATFAACMERNIESFKSSQGTDPDDLELSGIRHVCRQQADEEAPLDPR